MIEIGSTAEAAYFADDDDMASSFCIAEHDVFAEVFSTARMIALDGDGWGARPEPAAPARPAFARSNGQHQTSCRHAEPHLVFAQATFLGMESKLYKF